MEQLPGNLMPALHWVSAAECCGQWLLAEDKLQLGCWQDVLCSPVPGLSNLVTQSHKQREPLKENSAIVLFGVGLHSLQENNHKYMKTVIQPLSVC